MAILNLALSLKQTRANAITAALGAGALIRIYQGSMPASPEAVISGQTLLSTMTGNASAFAGAATTTGINNIAIGSGGSGYSSAPTVAFTGGGGSGAAATAAVAGGVVSQVNITNPGAGYTSAPTIAFTGGGATTAATATAALGVALNANAITQDSSAAGSGAPTFARIVPSGTAAGAAGILDVDVGAVGSTAAMQISPASVTAGAPVSCTSFVIGEG